jgi:Rad52/22 family double-strand break repair protein
MHDDISQALSAPFDVTFTDTRGGIQITYISGEQCVRRLNDVLGVGGWTFRILEHGINAEADEAWVLGELTADIGERTVTRQQFGSSKIKRARSNGTPLDVGFDLKAAATDAMKKCASLLGVGLYLSKRETPQQRPRNEAARRLVCEDCGADLRETQFKDGTSWTAAQLANQGQRKHGRVLCMLHYRARAETSRQEKLGA